MVTAFDTVEIDVRPVPVTVGSQPVRTSTELEPAACGCTMVVPMVHASIRRDEAQEESYLQTYALGSMRPCRRSTEDDDHELPTVTLDIEDDTGFILESRQAVAFYGDEDADPPKGSADWLFATTMSLDEFSESPAHVVFRSP